MRRLVVFAAALAAAASLAVRAQPVVLAGGAGFAAFLRPGYTRTRAVPLVNVSALDFWVDPWITAPARLITLQSSFPAPLLQVSVAQNSLVIEQGSTSFSVALGNTGWRHVAINLTDANPQVWINGTLITLGQTRDAAVAYAAQQQESWTSVAISQVPVFSAAVPSKPTRYSIERLAVDAASCRATPVGAFNTSAPLAALLTNLPRTCSAYAVCASLTLRFAAIILSNSSLAPVQEAPSIVNRVGFETSCPTCDASAFDRDVASSWTGCELQYALVSRANASHYALVYSSALASAWTLYADAAGNDDWLPVDRQPASAAAQQPLGPAALWLRITVPGVSALRFKLVFDTCPVTLQEFGLFDMPNDALPTSGLLSSSDSFYYSTVPLGVTGPALSNSFVVSTSNVLPPTAAWLSIAAAQRTNLPTQQLVIGSAAFTGLVDEVRLWAAPALPAMADLYLQTVSPQSTLPDPAVLVNFDDDMRVPSRARAFASALVYVVRDRQTVVTLTGYASQAGDVTVKTTDPRFGTLSALLSAKDALAVYGAAALATVTYTAPKDFSRDSFTYEVALDNGKSTAQGTVLLVAARDFNPVPPLQSLVLALNASSPVCLPAVPSLVDNAPELPIVVAPSNARTTPAAYALTMDVTAPVTVVWRYANSTANGTLTAALLSSRALPGLALPPASSLVVPPAGSNGTSALRVLLNTTLPTDVVLVQAAPAFGSLVDDANVTVLPVAVAPLFTVFASNVLRVSSQASSLPEPCVQACERWLDAACAQCLALLDVLLYRGTDSPVEMLGTPDGRCFHFAPDASGRQFVELALDAAVTPVTVRLTVAGGGAGASSGLIAVTFLQDDDDDAGEACGPTGLPASPLARAAPSCAAWPLLRTDDCADHADAQSAWNASCPPTMDANGVVEVTVCPQSRAASAVRLDFDSGFWSSPQSMCIDGVAVVGTDEQTRTGLPGGGHLAYTPLPGVSGVDAFNATVRDCSTTSETTLTVRISIPSASGAWPLGSVEGPDNDTAGGAALGVFALTVNWTGLMDSVALNLYGAAKAANVAWPLDSALSVELVGFATPAGDPVASAQILSPSKVTPGLGNFSALFAVSVPFAALVGGSHVVAHSRLTMSQPTAVKVDMATSVFLACPSSASLGKCSAARKSLVIAPGVCTLGAQGFSCKCTSPPLIVVSGDACQYDSLGTCHGRGDPDALGNCACYQPKLFGGPNCLKRFKPATSPGDLYAELVQTMQRIGIPGLSVQQLTVNITALVDAAGNVLASLDFASESNPLNSCNGNGVPTPEVDCDCDPGYLPATTCLQNHGCFGSTLGQYLDGAGCRACPVNEYCPDGINNFPCPAGNFTLAPGAFQCYTNCIEAGFAGGGYLAQVPGSVNPTCLPCEQGSACSDGVNMTLCEPGFFSPAPRLVQCLSCASAYTNGYSESYGATACTLCPDLTLRPAGTTGRARTDCVCMPSYWNNNRTHANVTGVPCGQCPPGASCDGGDFAPDVGPYNTRPYSQYGYWGDPDNPSQFFACTPASKCLGNFTCAYGYTDTFCMDCSNGFYLLGGPGGSCAPCPADAAGRQVLVVLGVLGILLAFAFINQASSEVCALDTALLYVQLASVVQQMNFTWPYPVSILNYPFAAANFDLDFVSQSCVAAWTFQDHFFIIWFMIWILFGFQCLMNLIAWVYMRSRTRRALKAQESSRSMDLNQDPRVREVRRWVRELFGLPRTRELYAVFTDRQIATWLNFVRIVYNSILIVCLQTFMCIEIPDGSLVLIADPSTVCGSTSHLVMLGFGAVGLALYGVGLPVAFFLVLRHGETTGLKSEDQFLRRFGFLYVDFRQTHFRWELVVLARRFTVIVIMVVSNNVWAQALFSMLALGACLALQINFSPYLETRINVLEGIALASLCFYVLCGTLFTAMEQGGDPTEDFSTALSYVLLILSLGTVIVCLYIFFQSLRDYFAVLLAERSLLVRARTDDVGMIRVLRSPLDGPGGDNNNNEGNGLDMDLAMQWNTVMHGRSADGSDGTSVAGGRRLRRASLLFQANSHTTSGRLFATLDKDHDNQLSKGEVIEYARTFLGLQSDEAARKIEGIFNKFDKDTTGQIDRAEFEDMIRAQIPNSKDAELKKTIKAKYLVEWAASGRVTPLLVALFFELDEKMNAIVADDSIVSAYRDSSRAKFYRRLAEVFPFLTDWLAACAQEDLEAFRRILNELNSVSDTCGTRGTFSRITVEIDRAPVVYWLLQASEQERLVFRTVFGSMCEGRSQLPMWQRLKGGNAVKGAKGAKGKRARRRPDETPASPPTNGDDNGMSPPTNGGMSPPGTMLTHGSAYEDPPVAPFPRGPAALDDDDDDVEQQRVGLAQQTQQDAAGAAVAPAAAATTTTAESRLMEV